MALRPLNRRHFPDRRKTHVAAVVTSRGAHLSAVIQDVGFEGMGLSLPHNLAPGTAITIEAMNKHFKAVVCWSRSRCAGVHLLQRLDGQTLLALEGAGCD